MTTPSDDVVGGRLVLPTGVLPGRLHLRDGRIEAIEPDDADRGGPIIAPGFIDLHVHGWGGHSAMGERADLDGMARALLRRGVTAFLPTAVTAPLVDLARFAETVRAWSPAAPGDGSEPLGFNLEGPFLAEARKGAHEARYLRTPADVRPDDLAPLVEGLRVITIAPELPGAADLIERLSRDGIVCSMGHSAATLEQARTGYHRGARSTTHLFNAMTGVDHRQPGLAVAALEADDAFVELIADGHHVHPALWPLIGRIKRADRVLLVSDAVPLAGTGAGRGFLGGLEVEVVGDRCTLVVGGALAGSVIALDAAVRNLVREGIGLSEAVAAASANPAALLGLPDRGRLEVGCRADLVELDDQLRVRRVRRGDGWIAAD